MPLTKGKSNRLFIDVHTSEQPANNPQGHTMDGRIHSGLCDRRTAAGSLLHRSRPKRFARSRRVFVCGDSEHAEGLHRDLSSAPVAAVEGILSVIAMLVRRDEPA